MNSLIELQQRKAELKAQIEQERIELKKTFMEAKAEIEPSFLLKKAFKGLFSRSNKPKKDAETNIFEQYPVPISLLIDLLAKDRKTAFLLDLFVPMAWKFLPKLLPEKAVETTGQVPVKARFYGGLKRGIGKLRRQLKDRKKEADQTTEPDEK